MIRWLVVGCWWLGTSALAAEGYDFSGPARVYLYTVNQEVAWVSAGDSLRFTSEIAWKLALKARSVGNRQVELGATVVRVIARHDGPGSSHRFDSASADDDALLGHLKAVEGAVLGVTVDRTTGRVSAVTGGEAIVSAITARAPNRADPTAPSPLAASAAATYAPEALVRQWDALLALPGAEAQVALAAPLSGNATRTWDKEGWTLRLAPEALPMVVQLFRDPTPVSGQITAFSASGTASVGNGWPLGGSGTLRFTLALGAMTQPVNQEHTLRWTLADITQR